MVGKLYGGPPPDKNVAQITIQDLVDDTIFKCHAMPTSMGYSKNVNWSSNDIIGRSSPIYGYQSSGSTGFNLTIPLHGPIEASDERKVEHVKEACDWFHSLTYPDYGGDELPRNGGLQILRPPHRVLVTLANWKSMVCIVMNVSIDAGDVWDVRTGLPTMATVTITLQEVDEIPKGVYDVRPMTEDIKKFFYPPILR